MIEELAKKYTSRFEVLYSGNEMMMDKELEKISKTNNVDKEELQREMRKKIKEQKYSKARGMTKYYHSSSLETAVRIIEDGALISAKEREKRGQVLDNVNANTRIHGVQFTNDNYTQDGKLISTGYKQGRGAVGSDITFVFGDELYNDSLFDAFGMYPSIDYISLDKCLAIICTDSNIKSIIKELLDKKDLKIQLYTKEEFDVSIYSSDLKKNAELNEMYSTENEKQKLEELMK